MVDFLDRIVSWTRMMLNMMFLLTCIHKDTWQVNGQICQNAGWRDYGDSQYLIVNTGRWWNGARTHCQSVGGDLATITSREQTNFLISYTLKSYAGYNYLIGLNDRDGNRQYTWIDGTQSGYSNWVDNTQPSTSGQCIVMRSTYSIVDQGKWQTSSCYTKRVSICQRQIDPLCLWHRFGQSLFHFYGESKSFTDARADCMGGDLAIIKSSELRGFLVNIISNPPPQMGICYRIGLIDRESNNTYTWVDNTTLVAKDEFWIGVEPNGDDEDCVCMNAFAYPPQGGWYDVSCVSRPSPYLCERTPVIHEAWTHFPNVQYYMPGFSANYFTATEYCQQLGGTLAQPKTPEIYTNIASSFGNDVWFGLDSLKEEGVYQWADGTLLRNSRLTMWKSGKPDNLQGYQFCVAQVGDGWDNLPCSEEHNFLCEKSKGCPAGKWNVPVCDLLCDNCYNGGVCNHQTGSCICAPGFAGKNCLTACGDQKFGFECGHVCGSDGVEDYSCSNNRVCLLEPNQCSCLAGYEGVFCNETCTNRKFGSDCLQDCHCMDGTQCDISTGRCDGSCENGWSGDGCQIPSVCPKGYFGVNCTDQCNCPGNTDCDKYSGFCTTSEGQCDVGSTADSVDMPDSCSRFTGCFNSCSSTCHCRDGEDDCNSVNGSCTSGRCHPRWTGDNCQIDRFQSTRQRTNPGVMGIANFTCAISFDSTPHVGTDYVKASIGDFSFSNWEMAESPPLNISSTLLNFSFYIEDFPDRSAIYCFIGNPLDTSSEFAYVRLSSASTFVLPSLVTPPNVVNSSFYWVVISWRMWDASNDLGEGPITGYKVYVHTEDGNETHTATVLPDGSLASGSMRNKRELGSLEYNISGLEDGTAYEVRVAAIREGPKGEGDRGPVLNVKTQELLPNKEGITGSVAAVAGGAIGGIFVVVCLVIIIILLLRRKRSRHDNVGKRSNLPQPSNNDYIFPGQADEELGGSVPAPSAPSPSPKKPAVSPRHVTLPAASRRPMDAKDGGVPSVTAPESCPKERHAIPLSDFPAFVQKNRHSNVFQEEFSDLPEANIYPQTVAKKKINFEKNRYKNILPYDSTRVQLAILNDDPTTDYFNASFIPSFQQLHRYIASQGPNNASMDDFWRMVWQENVATIAMVTNLREGNKIKCRQYWPEDSTTPIRFGDSTIELESVQQCSGGSRRSLVLRKEKEMRFVNQFHYTKWPDRDVPRDTSSLLKFISEVQKDHGQNDSPLLIHCSAGVGRTGVVISIDSVVAEAKRNKQIDVFGFVSKIRQNRPFMVQTQEQYKFVYEAILESLLSEGTDIPVNYFSARLAKLHDADRNSTGRRTTMSIQYENIKTLCPDPPASLIRTGSAPENRPKSRYGNSLPTEMNRVFLQSINTECSDFLNASFVKGQHGGYITTQMPMPNTVDDFWVMVLDYKPSAIIMLNDENQQDKTCARYWFDEGVATFGYLTVSTLSTTVKSGFIQRTLEVARGHSKARHVVEQYQFLDWPVDVAAQKKGVRSILALMGEVRDVYANQLDTPLLVHCLSGVGRSAVFCSVLECIAQIMNEDVVNVFQTVKMMRNDRMHFVQTEEEYSFIHVLIKEYLHANDYEQLPSCDDQEHTYGNIDSTPRAVESVYELTDIQGGASAHPSHTPTEQKNVNEKPKQVQSNATEGESVYENFGNEH